MKVKKYYKNNDNCSKWFKDKTLASLHETDK